MARKKHIRSIDELIKDKPRFQSVQRPDFTIPDLLNEIIEKTGATYEELGELLGMSGTHIGRIVRKRIPYLKEENLTTLVKAFDLPFERVVYANAISRFSNKDLAEATRGGRQLEAGRIKPQTKDAITAHLYVKLGYRDWRLADSNEEKVHLLQECSMEEQARVGWRLVQSEEPDTVYIRHQGIHMQSSTTRNHIIPENAIVEVQLMDPKSIRAGDVVFVQLRDEFATSYVYQPGAEGTDEYEEYHPINKNFPVHVMASRKGVDPPLSEQRIIIGRVNRIVDYSLLA